jgi:transposase IS66 family protein
LAGVAGGRPALAELKPKNLIDEAPWARTMAGLRRFRCRAQSSGDVLFEKCGQHQPLNRQAERYAKEGVPISLSTLANQVGGCTAALMPFVASRPMF